MTVGIVGGGLLWVWTRFAEIWLPSVMLYAGLVMALTGAVSLIVPLKPAGIRTRRAAAWVALVGIGIAAGALS